MALQDLTPELRTRLNRAERAVGLFVLLGTLLLLAGFSSYVYHTAQRKGWFVTKVAYCTTLPHSAAGLRIGDPVKLMGFDVGEITWIDAQPPDDIFNVYLQFRIRAPYYGYLWTEGSKVRVNPSDFLGNRIVEVTKGTNGVPTHLVWPIRQYSPREALALPEADLRTNVFLDAIDLPEATNRLVRPLQSLDTNTLAQLDAAGIPQVRIADRRSPSKHITAVWDIVGNHYVPYTPGTKPYWLPPDESPALTDRLDSLVQEAENGLPALLSLTNQLAQLLTNAARATANADVMLVQTQPLLSNLTFITANLTNGEGSLGRWLLPSDLYAGTLVTLTNANGTLTNASATLTNASAMLTATTTNMGVLVAQLQQPLQNLATIISNINGQVESNTNFVTTLRTLLADTDDLIEGLKRHWLFRSAFKPKPTNAPPARAPRPTTPKGALLQRP